MPSTMNPRTVRRSAICSYLNVQSSISLPYSFSEEAANCGLTQGKYSRDDIPQDVIIQVVVDKGVCERLLLIPGIAEPIVYIKPSSVFKWKSLVCKLAALCIWHVNEDADDISFCFLDWRAEEWKCFAPSAAPAARHRGGWRDATAVKGRREERGGAPSFRPNNQRGGKVGEVAWVQTEDSWIVTLYVVIASFLGFPGREASNSQLWLCLTVPGLLGKPPVDTQ